MAELKIAKNDLLPRLSMVSGAVDKKQSLPILSNFMFKLNEGQLVLTATDLEIEISAFILCESAFENAAVTIPAKKLIDIIRSLDDEAIATLRWEGTSAVIKAGRSQFKLATLPISDFPAAKYDETEIDIVLSRQALIELLQSTHFAMGQQDVRVFLNGMLFEIGGTTVTTVATDGHRMAISKTNSETSYSPEKILLPKKCVQELLKLLNSVLDESITISMSKSHFSLKTNEYIFSSKLLEARFPPYAMAIPRDNDKFVLLDKDQLKRALQRIVILANEKSKGVCLHIQSGTLTLIAKNQEQEEAVETIEANVDGDELKIAVNASYLLDVLNYISDSTVRLSMSTVDRSILVEALSNENYQYILMPMKL